MKANDSLKIGEVELRSALKAHLSCELRSSDRVIEELGIENGAARIDLAVISNRVCGYEIKSDFDNALRLTNQIHSYNRVFEHIWMVTGPKSASSIEHLLPSWWGIIRAIRSKDGSIKLREVRLPTQNSNRDIYSLLTLFKREELNLLAIKYAVAAKTIKGSKPILIDALANLLSLEDVNKEVAMALKSRVAPTIV